jgi:hypothetical protein
MPLWWALSARRRLRIRCAAPARWATDPWQDVAIRSRLRQTLAWISYSSDWSSECLERPPTRPESTGISSSGGETRYALNYRERGYEMRSAARLVGSSRRNRVGGCYLYRVGMENEVVAIALDRPAVCVHHDQCKLRRASNRGGDE